MDIDERIKISILNKYYGKMLTDKQREIITMYVDNNLSLAEVSEVLSISRQAVKDALDSALNSLKTMEEKLGFIARDERIKTLVENKPLSEISITSKLEIIQILED